MKIYAIGIGPGAHDLICPRAIEKINEVDVVSGYTKYLELISDLIQNKELISSGMTGEIERCQKALDETLKGKKVAVISSGDSGIYAMAGLLLEMIEQDKYSGIDVDVIPGVTAANTAAAILGAPLMNDFVTMSLSDLMTPKEVIKKRLKAVSVADLVCVLYNPRSKKRRELFDQAVELYLEQNPDAVYGMVKHASREKQEVKMGKLSELPVDFVDMSTVVILGNSNTVIRNKKLYTLRGYQEKYNINQ